MRAFHSASKAHDLPGPKGPMWSKRPLPWPPAGLFVKFILPARKSWVLLITKLWKWIFQ